MTITYRAMIPLDIPVVAAMEKEIFKDDPWSIGQFKEEISNNGITRHYLVACDGNHQIIGWAGPMCATTMSAPACVMSLASSMLNTYGVVSKSNSRAAAINSTSCE